MGGQPGPGGSRGPRHLPGAAGILVSKGNGCEMGSGGLGGTQWGGGSQKVWVGGRLDPSLKKKPGIVVCTD